MHNLCVLWGAIYDLKRFNENIFNSLVAFPLMVKIYFYFSKISVNNNN